MPDSTFPDQPPFFPQEAPNTCAVACLRMVLSAYGVNVSEAELARRSQTNEFGTELGELVRAAEQLGFESRASPSDLEGLRQMRWPIVYLDGPTLGRSFFMHAVVLGAMGDKVRVLDPAGGIIDLPLEQFRDAWETAGSFAVELRPRPVPPPP